MASVSCGQIVRLEPELGSVLTVGNPPDSTGFEFSGHMWPHVNWQVMLKNLVLLVPK